MKVCIVAIAAVMVLSCVTSYQPRSTNEHVENGRPNAGGSAVQGGVTWDVAAPMMAAAAAGAAAQSRAEGGCYTPCVKGTACNPKTGLCDDLPCRGECSDREVCVHTGRFSYRCDPVGLALDLAMSRPDAGSDRQRPLGQPGPAN